MNCPYCGRRIKNKAVFCPYCGKRTNPTIHPSESNDAGKNDYGKRESDIFSDYDDVVNMSSSSGSSIDRTRRRKTNKKRMHFFVLIAVFVILLCIAGFVGLKLLLQQGQGADEEISHIPGTMRMLGKGFSDIKITDEETAIKAAAQSAEELGYENAMKDLVGYYTTTVDGETFYRLQQTYKGIPVYGRYVVVVAGESGQAVSLSTDVRDLPDQIDTTITVSDSQIKENVKEYAIYNWRELHDDIQISPVQDASKVIYDLTEEETACIGVLLYVENGEKTYEVVADGKTGVVKSAVCNMLEQTSTGTDGINSFPVDFDGNNTYTLGDSDRNIEVFYFNGGTSGNISEVENLRRPVTSIGDNVFGNTQEEVDINCQQGVDFYLSILKIIDYYQDSFGKGIPFGNIKCGYDDHFDNGQNARGGTLTIDDSQRVASIYLGTNVSGDSYTDIGHEYTHCIQFEVDAAIGETDPGICEGLADLFGVFFNAHCTGTLDWDIDLGITHRNAASPERYHYPKTVLENNKSPESDEHAYATAVARIGYLMYESGHFSLDDLQKLWYKTLNRLPHSPSYGFLRDCMEQTVAAKYGIGSSELTTVQDIFYQIGIISGTYIECGNDPSISVYDRNGELYDDYDLEINGTKISGFLGRKKEEFHQSHTVNSTEAFPLHLENGTYTVSITDRADYRKLGEQKTNYLQLIVSEKNTNNVVECMSGFGSDYVAVPGAQLTVLDAEENVFKDYEATASTNTDSKGIEIHDGQLNLEEHNNYRIVLANRKGDTIFLDTFTLRISDAGDSTIVRKTSFVEASIIKGKVIDSISGTPVPEVTVTYEDKDDPSNTATTTADKDGKYTFENVPAGNYNLRFTHEYYKDGKAELKVGTDPKVYEVETVELEPEDDNDWYSYIRDNYVEKWGFASLETTSKRTNDSAYSQHYDVRNGVLSVQIEDLNKDGTDECAVYYLDKSMLYISILTTDKNGRVVEKVNRELYELYGLGFEFFDCVGGIIDSGGRKYIYVEAYSNAYFANGYDAVCYFYAYDGINLRPEIIVGKTEGGSIGFVYSIDRYDINGKFPKYTPAKYNHGERYTRTILCTDGYKPDDWDISDYDTSIMMDDYVPEEAMALGMEIITDIKPDIVTLKNADCGYAFGDEFPTYRNSNILTLAFHFNSNGPWEQESRNITITVEDNTNARQMIEK